MAARPSLSLPTVSETVAGVADPDALYAMAFSSVHADASFLADLSPGVAGIVSEGERLVSQVLGPDGAAKLGAAVLGEVESLVGADTVQAVQGMVSEVVNAVSDYVPLIGAAVSGVFGAVMGQLNQDAAERQAYEHASDAVLGRQVPLSGYDNTFQPSDLFSYDSQWEFSPTNAASYPEHPTNPAGYPYCPYAPFGLALAALTEDGDRDVDVPGWNGTTGDGGCLDNNLHHPSAALRQLYVGFDVAKLSDPSLGSPLTMSGISAARRRVYQNLRRAMGSRNRDQGATLWPIYLDMLVADFDRGVLSEPFMVYLLTHYWDGKHIHDADGSGEYNDLGGREFYLPVEVVAGYARRLHDLLNAWKAHRKVVLHPLPHVLHLAALSHLPVLVLNPKRAASPIARAVPYVAGGGLSLLLLRSLADILPRGRR